MVAWSHVTARYNDSAQSPSDFVVHFVSFRLLTELEWFSLARRSEKGLLTLAQHRARFVSSEADATRNPHGVRPTALVSGEATYISGLLGYRIRCVCCEGRRRVLLSCYGCACRGEDMDKLRNLFVKSDASNYVPRFI